MNHWPYSTVESACYCDQARIRDHVRLSERRRMRKNAIMDLQNSDTNKSLQRLRVSKRYQPLWLLTMLSSRQNQFMMSIAEAPGGDEGHGTTCAFPPVDAKDEGGGLESHAKASSQQWFHSVYCCQFGPQSRYSIDLHFALGPLRFHILLAK